MQPHDMGPNKPVSNVYVLPAAKPEPDDYAKRMQPALDAFGPVEDPPYRGSHYSQELVRRCVRSKTSSARIGTPSDRKSTRLNSSHSQISYAVFCLKTKKIYIA